MTDERNSDRSPCHELVEYTIVVFKNGKPRFLDLTGKIINKSRSGFCFITRYPLKSGHVLAFRSQVFQHCHGVVMWIKNIGGIYMAGTQLVGKVTPG